jgi:hypothetical protein
MKQKRTSGKKQLNPSNKSSCPFNNFLILTTTAPVSNLFFFVLFIAEEEEEEEEEENEPFSNLLNYTR